MKIINGNILDIEEGVICHQVNCWKVANAGLARQMRNKWPARWYVYYKQADGRLGGVRTHRISQSLYVADLYAQEGFGTAKRHTNYAALGHCLMLLKDIVNKNTTIYIPYGIGCGLGGGDWAIVSQIIEDALPDAIVVKRDLEDN